MVSAGRFSAAKAPLLTSSIAESIIVTLVLSISGIWYFRKMERTFADII